MLWVLDFAVVVALALFSWRWNSCLFAGLMDGSYIYY
jgi:hypothetical protein